MKSENASITFKPAQFTTHLPGAVSITVDLAQVPMTERQTAILAKLLQANPLPVTDECSGDDCPASGILPPDEFAEVRNLKAQIGGSGSPAKIIINFCLKIINLDRHVDPT